MRLLSLCLLCLVTLPPSALAAGQDGGRFVVRSPQFESEEWRTEAREMQETGTLQELAKRLNEIFVLPRDVGLRFVECGQANAYYSPADHEISMCLELMAGMAETLQGQFEDEDSTANALAGAYIAVTLHEAGHALVDVLELPVTGREEDAVDQLSAWMLIEADDADSVLGAAATYYVEQEADDDDYADEHSLNKQRYFNLVCWAYGSDPENRPELISDWLLPEARAEDCADEYAQLDRSWSRLLAPHLREGGVPEAAEDDTPTPQPPRGIDELDDVAVDAEQPRSTPFGTARAVETPQASARQKFKPINDD
jgi:hypothetical protein